MYAKLRINLGKTQLPEIYKKKYYGPITNCIEILTNTSTKMSSICVIAWSDYIYIYMISEYLGKISTLFHTAIYVNPERSTLSNLYLKTACFFNKTNPFFES